MNIVEDVYLVLFIEKDKHDLRSQTPYMRPKARSQISLDRTLL